MAISLKELVKNEDLLTGGHRACAGCTGSNILRQIMLVAGENTVMGGATGCMEVVTTIYPYTAWKTSFIHSAFENVAATISGAETAYRALKKSGELTAAAAKAERMNFIAFGGDGGTYDIGFQSLSGAMERGHNMLYVCYDNEAYMNTGIQRSSATPVGSVTSTTASGKKELKKNIMAVMAAHRVPYAATLSIGHRKDFLRKVRHARSVKGFRFLLMLSPCPTGWKSEPDQSTELIELAVRSGLFPLYEVFDGVRYRINFRPDSTDVSEYTDQQRRFRKVWGDTSKLQEFIDAQWQYLDGMATVFPAKPPGTKVKRI